MPLSKAFFCHRFYEFSQIVCLPSALSKQALNGSRRVRGGVPRLDPPIEIGAMGPVAAGRPAATDRVDSGSLSPPTLR